MIDSIAREYNEKQTFNAPVVFTGTVSGVGALLAGNAATATLAATATVALACSGNAATATSAAACSGNAATATLATNATNAATAAACSGNAATATSAAACSGNAATATLAAKATANTTQGNSLLAYLSNGLRTIGTLLMGTATQKFQTTTTAIYTIAGLNYAKVATDALEFSAAYTINTGTAIGQYWGAFLVQINAAGAVSTKAVSADQVYATEAAAIAALPAVDAGNVQLGYIAVRSNAGADPGADPGIAWVAKTGDLDPASDCDEANFYNLPAPATLPSVIA